MCCFTLKLPSPSPVTHTTPRHLAQALLRCYPEHNQGSRQTWFIQVGSSAEFWKLKWQPFARKQFWATCVPKLGPPTTLLFLCPNPPGSHKTQFTSPIKSSFPSSHSPECVKSRHLNIPELGHSQSGLLHLYSFGCLLQPTPKWARKNAEERRRYAKENGFNNDNADMTTFPSHETSWIIVRKNATYKWNHGLSKLSSLQSPLTNCGDPTGRHLGRTD